MQLPRISLGWMRRTKTNALDVTKKAAKKVAAKKKAGGTK